MPILGRIYCTACRQLRMPPLSDRREQKSKDESITTRRVYFENNNVYWAPQIWKMHSIINNKRLVDIVNIVRQTITTLTEIIASRNPNFGQCFDSA